MRAQRAAAGRDDGRFRPDGRTAADAEDRPRIRGAGDASRGPRARPQGDGPLGRDQEGPRPRTGHRLHPGGVRGRRDRLDLDPRHRDRGIELGLRGDGDGPHRRGPGLPADHPHGDGRAEEAVPHEIHRARGPPRCPVPHGTRRRIRAENMLGSDETTAFYGAMKTLESSRPLVASGAVGIARAAYEYALEYSRRRKAFGAPIAKKQAIAFMLADMRTKIDAARLLTWRAASMGDHGLPMNKEASMAKLFAADMAMGVTTDAVQVLGGAGYMKDEPVEKWVRDAKGVQILDGTSQIQRMVISREEIGEL